MISRRGSTQQGAGLVNRMMWVRIPPSALEIVNRETGQTVLTLSVSQSIGPAGVMEA